MMKKLASAALLLFGLATSLANAQTPKYVFYFIGDGMGVNQVNATEMYRAEVQGRIGVEHLCFTQFPQVTMATTYSHSNGVTDSAASGTALATGTKTTNGMLGVAPDTTAVYSVAHYAHRAGVPVAIGSTLCVNHATPGAFFAHQASRNYYRDIAIDMLKAGYDFYSGAGINLESKYEGERDSIYRLFEKEGYRIAYGYDEYKALKKKGHKTMLFQARGSSNYSIPYAIDRNAKDLSLAQMTAAAIEQLTAKKGGKGFFMMMEGGRIDNAGHSDDGATNFKEIEEFDEAIKVAYEFYKQHPDETLIVVTADHETGGMVMGYSGSYTLNLQVLQHQKVSVDVLYNRLLSLRNENPLGVTWEQVRQLLSETMGFWDKVPMNDDETERLRRTFDESFAQHISPMSTLAVHLMNRKALLNWASGNHSAGYVPVYAVGAGAERFSGLLDNALIPKLIMEVAGYQK